MMKFLLLFALVLSATVVQSLPPTVSIPGLPPDAKPIGRCPPRDIPNKPPRFLPDANDCRWYYECSGGKMTQKVCPEGTCFSRATKGCA